MKIFFNPNSLNKLKTFFCIYIFQNKTSTMHIFKKNYLMNARTFFNRKTRIKTKT